MIRVLRYPRMFAAVCTLTILCALGRDGCISAGLPGWANMLLLATMVGIASSFVLMTCRLTVDEQGIGVGFLLGMRYTEWSELATLGMLCCNSHRMYLYGTYPGHSDFINMLHMAPRCGKWGFVAPMSKKLRRALALHCPYDLDMTPMPRTKRPKGMRILWQQAALYTVVMIPAALIALATCGMMLVSVARGAQHPAMVLAATAMLCAGVFLIRRTITTLLTCPAISEHGVSIGRGVYMAWEDVYFAYIRRAEHMSGLFFLSRPLSELTKLGTPPVCCLSMPDTSTLLLAYLTYCPHAPKGM